MFRNYAAPWIRSQHSGLQPLYSVTLKFAGIGESLLAEQLADLIERQTDPTIAPYAKDGEVALRLSTKAASQAEADRKMKAMIEEIQNRVGRYLYATRDVPLEQAVVEWLMDAKQTLSVAESCTGGLLGELITSIPGSSNVLMGGVISYSAKAKIEQLGVSEQTISRHGTISGETAEQMAAGCRRLFATDWALSVTGVAGLARRKARSREPCSLRSLDVKVLNRTRYSLAAIGRSSGSERPRPSCTDCGKSSEKVPMRENYSCTFLENSL